ncbi:tripartite tricarboxylate transporter TctB family protein [Ammoniphilus resinae]|uniref:DUF1468 domain-containing protein n=1 Tax=Ammoniphilus resinae TaxID=861532 RepID=A0ABS4GL24_9BACL|nr:tripartite tricarboxylate transporter TctB family protein [Ammoniphilus resinae]MBP1930962.1 hypothetical protein [Ammoniphilus resinae]
MKNAGALVGFLILIFAGTLFFQALSFDYYSDYGPGPGLFPLWLSGLLILLSIAYIIDCYRKNIIQLKDILPKGAGLRKIILIMVSLVVFYILAPFTGYSVAGIIMLMILFIKEYKWYWGLGISVVVTVVLFYTFYSVLNVPLPVNSFGL